MLASQTPNFEKPDSMLFNQDIAATILQTSSCNPRDPIDASKRRRARRGEKPLIRNYNQLTNEGEKGRASPPPPTAEQGNHPDGDVPDKNEGNIEPNSNSPIQTEPLSKLKEDTAVCTDPDCPIPVCGVDEARYYPYIADMGRKILVIDPANPCMSSISKNSLLVSPRNLLVISRPQNVSQFWATRAYCDPTYFVADVQQKKNALTLNICGSH